MLLFEELIEVSPLPIVDLNNIKSPKGGLLISTNKTCNKKFCQDNNCREYYKNIILTKDKSVIQCPNGFVTVHIKKDEFEYAITSLIPYPRLGGDAESKRAKQYPESKISMESIFSSINYLININHKLKDIEKATLQNQSMALHEIRKLNRNVKLTAERSYNKKKSEELLQILKTSELMSYQFDIIEILANESLTKLELKNEIELYRIIDKCVHVCQTDGRIQINCTPGFHPIMIVCDKTFPILLTVLIENSLKYSLPNSHININIEPQEDKCLLKIINRSKLNKKLDDSVFNRGVRFSEDKEGTGNGLYVAQLVAKQHGTKIEVDSYQIPDGSYQVKFSILFNTKNND